MNKPRKKQIAEKSLNNLISQKTSWKNLPTKVIRIPEIMADDLLAIAKEKDSNDIHSLKNTYKDKDVQQVISILQKSLKLPANKGGAIKKEIKEAIKLLNKNIKP